MLIDRVILGFDGKQLDYKTIISVLLTGNMDMLLNSNDSEARLWRSPFPISSSSRSVYDVRKYVPKWK